MLIKHIAANDKVLVVVDCDCDGFTSAALLLNYLNRFFPHAVQGNFSYCFHSGKQHGIIEEAITDDIKLVIAPDSSSNEYDIHKRLKSRGIDVLVIDHHEADKISGDACVINNQLCAYPNKDFSGVGMVYKFCCYLDDLMGEFDADDFLDLTAFGLVGDMVSIQSMETHELIRKGILKVKNPFFQSMIEKQAFQIKDQLTPFKISFYIVPFINAVCRVGTLEEKQLLFEAMLEYRAWELIPSTKRGCKGQIETRVTQAVRTCSNVKNRQQRDRDKGAENIEALIEEDNLLDHKILLVLAPSEDWLNPNLRGLVANELASKYHHPTLILSKRQEEDGEWVWSGSGRGLSHSKLEDFRNFLIEKTCVKWATGHANAFGAAIPADKIKQFIQETDELLADYDFNPSYKVDFILDAKLDNIAQIVNTIATYNSFWSNGLEQPILAVRNITLNNSSMNYLTKGKHPTVKVSLNGLDLLKFGVEEEEYNRMKDTTIDIVGTCELNEWGGVITPQIMIEDYEIVSKTEKPIYYF